jgi:hypothetical protein
VADPGPADMVLPGACWGPQRGTPAVCHMVFTSLSAHSRYGLHVSAQRARSAVEASHRSIVPNIPGVPWWAALLIAMVATAVGYGVDAASGHKQLTTSFAGCYIAGCVAAILVVRQSGVFTAVIQPPLILFCAVPGAYWLFHDGKVNNIKDLLINCGYPLIERFPLMLGTAAGVLLIGLVRWYFGMALRKTHKTTQVAGANDDAAIRKSPSVFSGIIAKLTSVLHTDSEDDDDRAEEAPVADSPRSRSGARSPRSSRPTRGSRTAQARSRSRHARPSPEDELEPPVERPRRQPRRREAAPRDFDAADPPRRPRRPRPQGDPDLRAQPPRERRGDSHGRRNPYERPASQSSRFDPYDPHEPAGPTEHYRPYEKPYEKPYEPREPYEPYEQPRRRPRPSSNGASPTHHPISQARYRGSAPRDELRDEPRAERRSRSRAPRRPQADNWEYDV